LRHSLESYVRLKNLNRLIFEIAEIKYKKETSQEYL
jgi:hypothetical protein